MQVGALVRRLRGLFRGPAIIYLLSTVLARGAAVVLIPLYTRRLSLAEYGDLALAQTAVILAATIVSLGLLMALSRFYFDGDDREEALRRSGSIARWIWLFATAGALSAALVATLTNGIGAFPLRSV